MSVVLASGSPRRKELMKFITEDFKIIVSNADETINPYIPPQDTVIELAEKKAECIMVELTDDDIIIAADTIVVINNSILGKPCDETEAYKMLQELSGKTHDVLTGVCILKGLQKICFVQKTKVEFYALSDKDINDYIKTGEPFDKAGAYGIQGKGALLIKGITGDFYNVMGFPIAKIKRALLKLK